MDTKRISLKACIAALALCASAAGAQTIYKQVDADGRVKFTDQPDPGARVVTSYDTARRTSRPRNDADESAQPTHGPMAVADIDSRAPLAEREAQRPAGSFSRRLLEPVFTNAAAATESPDPASAASAVGSKPVAPVRAVGDVERAVATYSPLQSPQASQVDAIESARRARQETQKEPAAGVLIVKPVPHERETAKPQQGFTAFYVMWAVTFFLLAGGLLYVAWQTFRLILRGAFPRWQLGLG